MRIEFVKAIDAVLASDRRSVLLTADLGYNAFEKLAERYGRRFLNVGVAEQNMMGVAAGMALTGLAPWTYSIAPFCTYRCLEQIRNDICLHDLPVRIVGNGGGYTYGVMGSTHHALEDLAVLKVLPGMRLFFPCSNNHVAATVEQMAKQAGPSYLRLAISGFQDDAKPLAENPVTLTRQYAERVRKGKRGLTLVTAGHAAQLATRMLATAEDLEVNVFGLARFPLDLESDESLLRSVLETRRVLFVEEHYEHGGIGESFAAAFAGRLEAFVSMCAVYRKNQKYGSSAFHLTQSGLTPETVLARARVLSA